MKYGIIAAVSEDNIIGVDNHLPWNFRGDLKRFMLVTSGTTVIMGRNTFVSMNNKPLKNRRNIVITRQTLNNIESFLTINDALKTCDGKVWFIGGEKIFAEAMTFCDLIDITYMPITIGRADAVRFPQIDAKVFESGPLLVHEYNELLRRREFRRYNTNCGNSSTSLCRSQD